MTIAVLKLEAGQTIPRPFARASSVEEMVELVATFIAVADVKAKGGNFAAERKAAAEFEKVAHFVITKNIDSERPIVVSGSATFYAFREA